MIRYSTIIDVNDKEALIIIKNCLKSINQKLEIESRQVDNFIYVDIFFNNQVEHSAFHDCIFNSGINLA